MQSEEFSSLARLRNGVETVPSSLRKNYHLDSLPRGKQRGKFFMWRCLILNSYAIKYGKKAWIVQHLPEQDKRLVHRLFLVRSEALLENHV